MSNILDEIEEKVRGFYTEKMWMPNVLLLSYLNYNRFCNAMRHLPHFSETMYEDMRIIICENTVEDVKVGHVV